MKIIVITNNIRDLLNAELKFPNLKILTPETLLQGEWYGNFNCPDTWW